VIKVKERAWFLIFLNKIYLFVILISNNMIRHDRRGPDSNVLVGAESKRQRLLNIVGQLIPSLPKLGFLGGLQRSKDASYDSTELVTSAIDTFKDLNISLPTWFEFRRGNKDFERLILTAEFQALPPTIQSQYFEPAQYEREYLSEEYQAFVEASKKLTYEEFNEFFGHRNRGEPDYSMIIDIEKRVKDNMDNIESGRYQVIDQNSEQFRREFFNRIKPGEFQKLKDIIANKGYFSEKAEVSELQTQQWDNEAKQLIDSIPFPEGYKPIEQDIDEEVESPPLNPMVQDMYDKFEDLDELIPTSRELVIAQVLDDTENPTEDQIITASFRFHTLPPDQLREKFEIIYSKLHAIDERNQKAHLQCLQDVKEGKDPDYDFIVSQNIDIEGISNAEYFADRVNYQIEAYSKNNDVAENIGIWLNIFSSHMTLIDSTLDDLKSKGKLTNLTDFMSNYTGPSPILGLVDSIANYKNVKIKIPIQEDHIQSQENLVVLYRTEMQRRFDIALNEQNNPTAL
jgi:hypothetical protein